MATTVERGRRRSQASGLARKRGVMAPKITCALTTRRRPAPDGTLHRVTGTYREVEPPNRPVCTWQGATTPGATETLGTVERLLREARGPGRGGAGMARGRPAEPPARAPASPTKEER